MTQLLIDRSTLEQAIDALRIAGELNHQRHCGYKTTGATEAVFVESTTKAIITLRAALATNAEPAGWQKIETAPEGTMILCANMKAMDARSWAYVAWIAGGKVYGHRMDMPTHWMPLPTPPKEQQ